MYFIIWGGGHPKLNTFIVIEIITMNWCVRLSLKIHSAMILELQPSVAIPIPANEPWFPSLRLGEL